MLLHQFKLFKKLITVSWDSSANRTLYKLKMTQTIFDTLNKSLLLGVRKIRGIDLFLVDHVICNTYCSFFKSEYLYEKKSNLIWINNGMTLFLFRENKIRITKRKQKLSFFVEKVLK